MVDPETCSDATFYGSSSYGKKCQTRQGFRLYRNPNMMIDVNGDISILSSQEDLDLGQAGNKIGSESNFFTNKGQAWCEDGEWNPPYFLNKDTAGIPLPRCESDPGCPFNEALPWSINGDATTTCAEVGAQAGRADRLYQGQQCQAVCAQPNEEVLPKAVASDPLSKGWTCSYGDMLGGSYCVDPASGYTVKLVDVLFAEYSIESSDTVDVLDFAYAFAAMYGDWLSSWRWMYKVDYQKADGSDAFRNQRRRLERLDTIKDEKELEAALSELSEQYGIKITKSRNLQSGMITYNVTQTAILEKSDPGRKPTPYHDMAEHAGMLLAAVEVAELDKPANRAFKATMIMKTSHWEEKEAEKAAGGRRLVGEPTGEDVGKMGIIQQPTIYSMYVLFGKDGFPVFQPSLAMLGTTTTTTTIFGNPTTTLFPMCKSDALPTVRSAIWNCTSAVYNGTVCTVACLPGKAALRSADTTDPNMRTLPIAAKWVSAVCQKDGTFSSPDTKFNMLYCASILGSDEDDSAESTAIVIAILVLAMAIMITTCIVCVCQRKKQIEGDVEAPPPVQEAPPPPPPPPPAPEPVPEPVAPPPAPEPVPAPVPEPVPMEQEEDMI